MHYCTYVKVKDVLPWIENDLGPSSIAMAAHPAAAELNLSMKTYSWAVDAQEIRYGLIQFIIFPSLCLSYEWYICGRISPVVHDANLAQYFIVVSYVLVQTCECDICGQKFPRSSSMTRHLRIQCYFYSMTRHAAHHPCYLLCFRAARVRPLRAEIPVEQQHDTASAHFLVFFLLFGYEASALITHVIFFVAAVRVRHLRSEIPA